MLTWSGTLGAVQMGIVQTAYANGASTAYVRDCLTSCEVVMTPTGVKHLHHAAAAFDIGIYYEANGHGTILFSPAMLAMLEQVQPAPLHQCHNDVLQLQTFAVFAAVHRANSAWGMCGKPCDTRGRKDKDVQIMAQLWHWLLEHCHVNSAV